MTALEIFLLIIGIVLIFGSFFLTDNKNHVAQVQEISTELTIAQKQNVQKQIDELIEANVEVIVDRTEAALDKISNEKMTSLSDYSENVIDDINKNHNEVMFLYDMLGEKEKELKTMLTQIEGNRKRIEDIKRDSFDEITKKADVTSQFFNSKIVELKTEMVNVVNAIEETAKNATEALGKIEKQDTEATMEEEKQPKENDKAKEQDEDSEKAKNKETSQKPKKSSSKAVSKTTKEQKKTTDTAKKENDLDNKEIAQIAENTKIEFETGSNNNKQILDLHNAGKSNIEIARELGLGMGEVKLVIDLFRGGKR